MWSKYPPLEIRRATLSSTESTLYSMWLTLVVRTSARGCAYASKVPIRPGLTTQACGFTGAAVGEFRPAGVRKCSENGVRIARPNRSYVPSGTVSVYCVSGWNAPYTMACVPLGTVQLRYGEESSSAWTRIFVRTSSPSIGALDESSTCPRRSAPPPSVSILFQYLLYDDGA